MLVTADHSPESIREFERMRMTHPATRGPSRPQQQQQQQNPPSVKSGGGGGGEGTNPSSATLCVPSLLVVYDSPTSNKLKCSPVFDVDLMGKPRVTGKGR